MSLSPPKTSAFKAVACRAGVVGLSQADVWPVVGSVFNSQMASNSLGDHPLKDPSGENFNVSFSNPFILNTNPTAVGLYDR